MTHGHTTAGRLEAGLAPGSRLPWKDSDRAAVVAMMRLEPRRAEWSALTERVIERGSARQLWEDEHPADLFGDGDDEHVLRRAADDVEAWKHAPFRFHTFMDDDYPPQLRSVRAVPPVVFTQGTLLRGDTGVCVVGSRQASAQGVLFAQEIARHLVTQGLTVIAGLAKGIDTVAHVAALEARGRTVAVLGNGLNRVYPRENKALQQEIAERGMLLTHFLPEYGPERWSFPARNVTMSAYSVATVVVEASEKSGTRIQAREAVAHGRPVILNASVVHATTWGRELLNEPGVHVAETPSDALRHVTTVLDHRAALSQLLGPLS